MQSLMSVLYPNQVFDMTIQGKATPLEQSMTQILPITVERLYDGDPMLARGR